MIRRFFKRLLTPPLVVLAAMIMFFEEWLWVHVVAFMAWVAKLPPIRHMEAHLCRLPPYPALVLLVLPGALLLPVKLAALYFIAKGHAITGISVILVAKVVGTAMVARLFTICKPALLTINWLRRLTEWLVRVRDSLYARIRSMPAWQTTVRLVQKFRHLSRFFQSGRLRRRWSAIRRRFGRKPPDAQLPSQTPRVSQEANKRRCE